MAPAALLERATLAAGILRGLVRLQAHGLTAPPAVTGWLVMRLQVDLVALEEGRRWSCLLRPLNCVNAAE